MQNVGASTYHALLAQVRYHAKKGGAQAAYTLSRATSNSCIDNYLFGVLTNPLDISEDQGFDSADRRHNLVVSGDYTFPWDIQLTGIFVYRSAPPYSATTAVQLDADPFLDRPEPRNSRRGDGFSTLDVRATKTFKLGSRVRAAVFWEVYNLFNWTTSAATWRTSARRCSVFPPRPSRGGASREEPGSTSDHARSRARACLPGNRRGLQQGQ
jgi:hypothetical protein